MKLYQIRVDIIEPGTPFPIVTHVFRGYTPDDAEAVHQAHRRADHFLQQCEDTGLYLSKVSCRVIVHRGWVSGTTQP